MKFQSDKQLDKQTYDWQNETANILEELLEARGYNIPKEQRELFLKPLVTHIRTKTSTNSAITWIKPTPEDEVDAFGDIIVFAVGAIMKLGYDPEITLQEISKEINSRKGSIIKGKFQKFKPDEDGYKKPYKANFSKAKLKENK